MDKGLLFLSLFLFTRITAFGQIQPPKTPQFSGFQPMNTPGSQPTQAYNYGNSGSVNQGQYPNRQYSNPPSPEAVEQDRRQRQREYQALQREFQEANRQSPIFNNLPSHLGEKDAEYYSQAYGMLDNMLTGKTAMARS